MKARPICIKCTNCLGVMMYGTYLETVKYKNKSADVRVKAWWCDWCNETIFDGKALLKFQKARNKLKDAN